MSEAKIVLAPLTGTEEQVQRANEVLSKARRELAWINVVFLLSPVLGIYILATTHDFGKAGACFVLPLGWFWNTLRLWTLGPTVVRLEHEFTITPKGLQFATRINDRVAIPEARFDWTEVAHVVDEGDAVVLRLRNGGTQRIPETMFTSPDQRSLVLSRATASLTSSM